MENKKVSEMSEDEKEQAKQEALKIASENIKKGNKNQFVVDLDKLNQEGFTGKVVMHRPTIDEEREIGVRWAKYKNQIDKVDVITSNICFYLATFDVIVDEAPEWFKPHELFDYELLNYVWEEYAEWRNTFRTFRNPKYQGDSQSSKSEASVVDTKRVEGSADRPTV